MAMGVRRGHAEEVSWRRLELALLSTRAQRHARAAVVHCFRYRDACPHEWSKEVQNSPRLASSEGDA